MNFTEAVAAVPHSSGCYAGPHTYFGHPCDCRSGECSCDRDARIAKGIDAVVEASGEDGTCGEVFTISELIVIFTEAAK